MPTENSTSDFVNSRFRLQFPQIALLLICCYTLQPLRSLMWRRILGIAAWQIDNNNNNKQLYFGEYRCCFIYICLIWVSIHADDMLATGFQVGRPRDRGSIPCRVQCFCLIRRIQNIPRGPLSLLFSGQQGIFDWEGGACKAVGSRCWPFA